MEKYANFVFGRCPIDYYPVIDNLCYPFRVLPLMFNMIDQKFHQDIL